MSHVDVRCRDSQNSRRVLGDVGGLAGREHRRVDGNVRDRDGDVLRGRAAVVVVRCHLHVVNIVGANVGRDGEIGSRLKRQHSAAGDREFVLVRTAGDGERDVL